MPAAHPGSGPTHDQEFMSMLVSWSNKWEMHTSHISRVIFEE